MRASMIICLAAGGLLAACGNVQPTPTATSSPPPLSIDRATCVGVARDVCGEVLDAAVNNLARNQSAFRPPATVVQDACRGVVPDYANGSACWYVTLPLSTGHTPQVIMARRHDGVVAQVGGDPISGQAIPYSGH